MKVKKEIRLKIISAFLAIIIVFMAVPITVIQVGAAETKAQLLIDTATAIPGETVELNVTLKNAPAISGMAISDIDYDTTKMTLTKVEWVCEAEIKNWNSSKGQGVLGFDGNTDTNGTVLKMTFLINDVVDDADVNISCTATIKKFNADKTENAVELEIVSGKIIIRNAIRGDVDGDGKVNSADAIYLLYHVMWGSKGYPINQNGDMDGNGKVNSDDAIYLLYHVMFGEGQYPIIKPCAHIMQATAAKNATCTENGNKPYWHCTKCDKYFLDEAGKTETTLEATVIPASHILTYVSAVAPTTEKDGNIEHWKCSVCNKYFLDASGKNETTADEVVIKKLAKDESTIVYNLYGSDTYLASIGVDNPNPEKFVSEKGLALSDINGPEGYEFAGWKDSSGKIVTEISPGMSRTINLTATWRLTEYSIDFLPTSNASEEINAMPTENVKYTTNKGLTQGELNKYTPTISGYRFLGWSDENGNIIKEITKGTTETVTLYANWASDWNRAEAINPANYEIPLVYEEDGKYMFAYHIGEIKDVVLDVMSDTYKFTAGGPTTKVTVISNKTIGETQANAVAETIAQATTKTSTWSLSKDWNSFSSVSRGHTQQSNEYCDKYDQTIISGSENISISGNKGGTTENKVDWGINAKIYGKNTTELGASATIPIKCVDLGVSAKNTTEIGGEISGHYDNTTVNTGYWNTAASYDKSSAYNKTSSVSSGYSKAVCDNYQIDNSYSQGGSSTTQEAVAVADTKSEEYSSSFSYVTETTETVKKEVIWDKGTEGSWRYVKTGNVAVIATVVYDTKTSTYSVFTQGILRDGTQSEGWQKSMEGGDFSDHQNYVIPFEVPGYVHDYINNAIGYSQGLDVDIETGIVNGYSKENPKTDKHLHIPDYFTQDNGDGTYSITKITGVAPGAFTNCTNLESVRLGKYITEISNNAFAGCNALKTIDSSELTSIGNNAFTGCTSLENYVVKTSVTSLGASAFSGVKSIIVNASNPMVAEMAISSGAKTLTVNLNAMQENSDVGKLASKILLVANSTETFTLNGRDTDGNAKTYSNIRIESNTAKDVTINGMNFVDNSGVVLKLMAENLTLNGVNIDATPNAAIILKSDNTNIALQGKCTVATEGAFAILGKNISLSRVPGSNITTYLRVNSGDIYACGNVVDTYDYLQQADGSKMTDKTAQKIVLISEDSYQQLLNDTMEWVLASEVPAGATIIGEKWSYTLRTNTTSSSPNMDGWTRYDKKRTSWGATQGPAYSDPSNGSRNVWSEQYVTSTTTYYNYYHRHINSTSCSPSYTQAQWDAGQVHLIKLTYQLEYKGTSSESSKKPYYGYYKLDGCPNIWYQCATFETYENTYGTRWYYQEPIYTYYFYRMENKESAIEVAASDTVSNVQKWVKYVVQ